MKKRHMLAAYDARMEQMKALADGAVAEQPRKKGRKGRRGAALGSDEEDSASEEEEEEEAGGINFAPLSAEAAPHGPSKLRFGDRETGTATIVEVRILSLVPRIHFSESLFCLCSPGTCTGFQPRTIAVSGSTGGCIATGALLPCGERNFIGTEFQSKTFRQ